MLLSFLAGLLLGLGLLAIYRIRAGAKLKALLDSIRMQSTSRSMPYESRIASAIASQTSEVEALKAQIQGFRQVLRYSPLGYLYLDDENRLIWCNYKARELLGIGRPNTPPRLLLAIIRSYELDQLVEQTRQTQSRCQQDWTFYSISPDPSNLTERPAVPLRGYGVPLEKGYVGIFLENRQEALMLIQQRDRWTSDVAHELKTPLTSIRLVSETLRSRVDETLVHWLDRLLNEVNRLTALVEDILELSHLEQLNERLALGDETDLSQMVHQAWRSLEPMAALKRLTFDYEGPDQLNTSLDQSLILRVLVNVLDNAIKHTHKDTTILIKLSVALSQLDRTLVTEDAGAPSASGILLEIIDQGHGFADKDLPHVFERFYRADPARSRVQEYQEDLVKWSTSTGLGLPIVQKIVQSYQGWVTAQNHPETQGGWLKIWLPGTLITSTFSIHRS